MSASKRDLRLMLKRLSVTADERTCINRTIVGRLLQDSPHVQLPNFTTISGTDVRCLFDHYDELYFGSWLRRALGVIPLEFRVSPRMTRAGGKTGFWRKDRNSPIERFEIAISSTLLAQTFSDDQADRTIRVTGLVCRTRLDALMRIMEHELVHLAELLCWDSSSCSQDRFQSIAWRAFGHTDHRHALITPRESAAAVGIRPGTHVRFDCHGKSMHGFVNRVTKRATVLVHADDGQQYSDGNTYRKYYVPVEMLEPVD
ncbi:MAG: hypothetical protein MK102_04130 [Fuerstiella sp.]|nr:hypothetical protein [Fuerstiella sp.]